MTQSHRATILSRGMFSEGGADSQDTARYGIVPWYRVEIEIGNVVASAPDRSQGVVLEGIEGEGIYVERADWPVLLCPVIGQAPVAESLVAARDGLIFNSPFRGLYLAHPRLVATFATQALKLSLIVFKTKGAVENTLSQPVVRYPVSSRVEINAANNQLLNIFVPPGARQLDFLRLTIAGAPNLTQVPLLTMLDSGGNPIVPVSVSQQIGPAIITYNFAPTIARAASFVTAQSGGMAAADITPWEFLRLPIPTACRQLNISWAAAAGLTPAESVEGVFS